MSAVVVASLAGLSSMAAALPSRQPPPAFTNVFTPGPLPLAGPNAAGGQNSGDGGKENPVAQQELSSATREAMGRLCWLVDWYREDLPLENQFGTGLLPVYGELLDPPDAYVDPPGQPPLDGKSILVFPDSYGFAKAILQYAPPGTVKRKEVVKKRPGTIEKAWLVQTLKAGWDLVVFACSVDSPDNNTPAIHEAQKEVTKLLLNICKLVNDNKSWVKKLCVLTCDNFAEEKEIHEELGVACVAHSGLFGFCNTARMELDIPLQYIDTEWSLPDTSMPLLAAEVFRDATFGFNSVRLLKNGRWVLKYVHSRKYEQADQEFELPSTGTVALSGGNGAVALVVGEWFVDQLLARARLEHSRDGEPASGEDTPQPPLPPLKIKFLSRSGKVTDEANQRRWETIKVKAKAAGVEVLQAICDVSVEQQVNDLVEQTPDLQGFIHSAGHTADMLLQRLEWEDVEQVWKPKSRAALYLHEAFERHESPIKFFWMFSSVTVYGNVGQLNYSASNSFLDGLARHRRAMGKPALSIQWGAWGEVGMAARMEGNLRRRWDLSDKPPFSNAEGLEGLTRLLKTGMPVGCVFKVNPTAFVQAKPGDHTANLMYQKCFHSQVSLAHMPSKVTTDTDFIYNNYQSVLGWRHTSLGKSYKVYVLGTSHPHDQQEYDDDIACW